MSKRRVLRLFLIAISTAATATPAPVIAELYVAEGLAALASGTFEQASSLAERALEFDALSSDALALRARASMHEQPNTLMAVEDLEQALALQRFSQSSPIQAAISLASLYNRVREWERSRVLLEGLELPPGLPWERRADLSLEYIRALYGLSMFREGDSALSQARELHPNDARLFKLSLTRESVPSLDYRRELDRLIAAAEGPVDFEQRPQRQALGELILSYGLHAPTTLEREWAAQEYLRLEFEDPLVSVLFLPESRERASDLFSRFNGSASLLTIERFLAHDSIDLIEGELDSFSGFARLDENRDGFWELEYQVMDGMVSRVARDLNQDGLAEVSVFFEGGEVAGARVESPLGSFELSFQLYPFVHQFSVETEEGEERFVLRPRSTVSRLLREVPLSGPRLAQLPQLVDGIRVPDVAEARTQAVRIDRFDELGRRYERTYQAGGSMVLVARDENRDGEFDSLTIQSGGLATQRVRDIDYDGYFETVEDFRSGRRVAMAIDEDDDGFPEVVEYDRGTTIREWDLNQDGRIDVREFLNWTDSVIREFPLLEQE
jgi:tetratricopeptide (TPR) repeat protein